MPFPETFVTFTELTMAKPLGSVTVAVVVFATVNVEPATAVIMNEPLYPLGANSVTVTP